MSKVIFVGVLLAVFAVNYSEQIEDRCFLPKDPGPCKSMQPKYYFNEQTGDCERFNYGGCNGNANRFDNMGACQDACYERPKPVPLKCSLPKVVGPCKKFQTKYYFNEQTGDCERFQYGGCQGNENRFNTLGDCISVCRT